LPTLIVLPNEYSLFGKSLISTTSFTTSSSGDLQTSIPTHSHHTVQLPVPTFHNLVMSKSTYNTRHTKSVVSILGLSDFSAFSLTNLVLAVVHISISSSKVPLLYRQSIL